MKRQYHVSFVMQVSACICIIGCRPSIREPDAPSVSSNNMTVMASGMSVNEVSRFVQRSECAKATLAKIESDAKMGDLFSARQYLTTNIFRTAYSNESQRCRQIGVSEYQAIVFRFLLAVNLLPDIGGSDILTLLRDYYYGNSATKLEILDSRTVESVVLRLVTDPYVDANSKAVDGRIRVIGFERSAGASCEEVTVRVSYERGSDVYYWLC